MRILIDAKELLDNPDRCTLLDLRGKNEYDTAHISGAVSLPAGNLPFKAGVGLITETDWAALLGGCGIGSRDAKIVAYDDGTTCRGVARFWHVAKHYGHGDVFILNGGFPAASGVLPLSHLAEATYVTPAVYTTKVTPGYFINLDDILANHGKFKLLDTRAPEEYDGSNRYGNPRGGHIHGATLAVMSNFFSDELGQSFANPTKLAQTMNNLGIRKSDFIVAY